MEGSIYKKVTDSLGQDWLGEMYVPDHIDIFEDEDNISFKDDISSEDIEDEDDVISNPKSCNEVEHSNLAPHTAHLIRFTFNIPLLPQYVPKRVHSNL